MNTSTACQGLFSEDLLEQYAMGKLSEVESGPLEEHLLICPACQQRLQNLDEFVIAAQAALAQLVSRPDLRAAAKPSKIRKLRKPVLIAVTPHCC